MFFENHNFKGQAGMSLVEVLIAAAIGALVLTLSTNFFRSFNEQKWAQENKANARMQREIVTNFLRAKVPVSIAALSVTAPTAAVWSCPSAGPCTFQTNTTDGIKILKIQSLTLIHHLIQTQNYSSSSSDGVS